MKVLMIWTKLRSRLARYGRRGAGLFNLQNFTAAGATRAGADHRDGVLQPTRRRNAPGWVCWINFSRSISYGSVGYGDGIVKAFLSALCSKRCVAVSSCMGIGASVVA
jgi:hypothetical protein